MRSVNRRQFMAAAAALGATAAWSSGQPAASATSPRERRDLFPEGVASGDPDARSVLLWTRRPFSADEQAQLRVEVAEDQAFSRVVASTSARIAASSDWTCRVLVGNLQPARVYWYRFIDHEGNASRVGRTLTAPADEDPRPVSFAFVSCQDINISFAHAYRRMLFEDARASEADRIQFVLHLGDFIYELVWYADEHPGGLWNGRPINEVVRYLHGERIEDAASGAYHIPTSLEDYRAVYRAYLRDPHIQDARARWPFVCIWDNHEFSVFGWQSLQRFHGKDRPSQTRKVAALQAWFEFQPARVAKASGPSLDDFEAPQVRDAPIERFDADGFGDEPGNRAAVGSLTAYRALRWGRHLELILTDQWSYRSEYPPSRPEAAGFTSPDFPMMFPQEALETLDGARPGRPAQTLLGAVQKAWFLERLEKAASTWKVWGNSLGTLDGRLDPRNLPPDLAKGWRGAGFATLLLRDYSNAFHERAQIQARVAEAGVTGLITLSGDRHSFWAGVGEAGVAFNTASVSGVSMFEHLTYTLRKDHPLRSLYIAERIGSVAPEPALNVALRHGVRAALEFSKTGDLDRARRLSNASLAPHLKFVDTSGHGYSTVRVTSEAFECKFVCIPSPIRPSDAADGGPIRYRVAHTTRVWKAGERPQLHQHLLEGDASSSL